MYSPFTPQSRWRVAAALSAALTAACDVPMSAPNVSPTDARLAAASVVAPPVSLEWQGVARAQVATTVPARRMSKRGVVEIMAAAGSRRYEGRRHAGRGIRRRDLGRTRSGSRARTRVRRERTGRRLKPA